MTQTDATMAAITEAVGVGRQGDSATARQRLTALWESIGADGDPLHRCTLAHYLADLCDHAAESLTWDVRALDAADSLTDERAQQHHASLSVRGSTRRCTSTWPTITMRLGAFEAAHRHLAAAEARTDALADDGYGAGVRGGIDNVRRALAEGSTERLPTH